MLQIDSIQPSLVVYGLCVFIRRFSPSLRSNNIDRLEIQSRESLFVQDAREIVQQSNEVPDQVPVLRNMFRYADKDSLVMALQKFTSA